MATILGIIVVGFVLAALMSVTLSIFLALVPLIVIVWIVTSIFSGGFGLTLALVIVVLFFLRRMRR